MSIVNFEKAIKTYFFASSGFVACLMFYLWKDVPDVENLYGIIYGNDFRHQAESTIIFLFGFPAMCLAISIVTYFSLSKPEKDKSIVRWRLMFPVLLHSCFAFGAVYRFFIVRNYFGM